MILNIYSNEIEYIRKLRARGLLGYARVIDHLCSTVKKKTHHWDWSDENLQNHLTDIASMDYTLHCLTCDLRTIHSNYHDLELIAKDYKLWAAKE